jgi:hypothetical protein
LHTNQQETGKGSGKTGGDTPTFELFNHNLTLPVKKPAGLIAKGKEKVIVRKERFST